MRTLLFFACLSGLTSLALAQQSTAPTRFGQGKSAKLSSKSSLDDVFQAKIKDEREAVKNKDKKAYSELLADDYEGVEVDGRSEREGFKNSKSLPGRLNSGCLIIQDGQCHAIVVAGLCIGDLGLSLLQLRLAQFHNRA